MHYPIELPGFENLAVQNRGFWSGPKLLVDGQPAAKGPKRGQFILQRDDGAEVIVQVRHTNLLDPVPQVIIDGQRIVLAEPLKWYQMLWGGLPLALVAIGGAVGGLCGGTATVINGRVMRSKLNNLAKFLVSGLVSIAAVVGMVILATLFNLSVRGFGSGRPQEYISQSGQFSVMTPLTFEESSQLVETEIGPIEMVTLLAERRNEAYAVMYSDYPADFVAQVAPLVLLANCRDGALANVGGELLADRDISLDGHPGREYVVSTVSEDGQQMTIQARIYLVEERLYQVTLVTLADWQEGDQVDDFLQSFKLLAE